MKKVYEIEVNVVWAGKDAGSEKQSYTVLATNTDEAFAKAKKHGFKQAFHWNDDEDGGKRKFQGVKAVEVQKLEMTATVDVL